MIAYIFNSIKICKITVVSLIEKGNCSIDGNTVTLLVFIKHVYLMILFFYLQFGWLIFLSGKNVFAQEIAAPIDRLQRLLLPNASLRSLKLDCRRLNESSIDYLLQPGLLELSLRNCFRFSGKLLAAVGARCKDLRLFPTSFRYNYMSKCVTLPWLDRN